MFVFTLSTVSRSILNFSQAKHGILKVLSPNITNLCYIKNNRYKFKETDTKGGISIDFFSNSCRHHLSLVSAKTTVIHGMVKLNTLFGNRLKCLTFHTFLEQKIIDTAFPLVFKVTRFIFHKK